MIKEKGKCFSACNQGQRNKNDYYQTPFSVTNQLLENYSGFDKNLSVLDPACGEKAIVKRLNEYFYKDQVSYSDLNLNGLIMINM